MFSGIVKSIGEIVAVEERNNGRECVINPRVSFRFAQGQSVLVSGICSTITRVSKEALSFFYMVETLKKTTAPRWLKGDRVNIEPSAKVGDTLDGHFVFGHVDGKGRIKHIEKREDSWAFSIEASEEILQCLVPKGSIALDGVSLTLIEVSEETFSVSLTPFTLEHTTFGLQKEGQDVNIEIDILAKYIKKFLWNKIP